MRGSRGLTASALCSFSTTTVGNYASNIFTKLQLSDRAQAIIRAREAGLG